MPSGVNYTTVTTLKMHMVWPLPELQTNLPPPSTEAMMSDKNVAANNSEKTQKSTLECPQGFLLRLGGMDAE